MRHDATQSQAQEPSANTSARPVSRSSSASPRPSSATTSSAPPTFARVLVARASSAGLAGLVGLTCWTVAVYASIWLVAPYLAALTIIVGVPQGWRLRAQTLVGRLRAIDLGGVVRRRKQGLRDETATSHDGARRRLGRRLTWRSHDPGAAVEGDSSSLAAIDGPDDPRASTAQDLADSSAEDQAAPTSDDGPPSSGPDRNGTSKSRRGRGRTRKAKPGPTAGAPPAAAVDTPTAVTWVRVGPGKFVRVDGANLPAAPSDTESEPGAEPAEPPPADALAASTEEQPADTPQADGPDAGFDPEASLEPAPEPVEAAHPGAPDDAPVSPTDPADVAALAAVDVEPEMVEEPWESADEPAVDLDVASPPADQHHPGPDDDGGPEGQDDPDDDPPADLGRDRDMAPTSAVDDHDSHDDDPEPATATDGPGDEPAAEDQGIAPEAFAALDAEPTATDEVPGPETWTVAVNGTADAGPSDPEPVASCPDVVLGAVAGPTDPPSESEPELGSFGAEGTLRPCAGLAPRRPRVGRRRRFGPSRADLRAASSPRWSAPGARDRSGRPLAVPQRPTPCRRNLRHSARFHHAHRTTPPRSPPVNGR